MRAPPARGPTRRGRSVSGSESGAGSGSQSGSDSDSDTTSNPLEAKAVRGPARLDPGGRRYHVATNLTAEEQRQQRRRARRRMQQQSLELEVGNPLRPRTNNAPLSFQELLEAAPEDKDTCALCCRCFMRYARWIWHAVQLTVARVLLAMVYDVCVWAPVCGYYAREGALLGRVLNLNTSGVKENLAAITFLAFGSIVASPLGWLLSIVWAAVAAPRRAVLDWAVWDAVVDTSAPAPVQLRGTPQQLYKVTLFLRLGLEMVLVAVRVALICGFGPRQYCCRRREKPQPIAETS